MGLLYQLHRAVLRPPRGDQHGKHTHGLINGTHHRCHLRQVSPLPGLLCGSEPPRDSGGRDRAPCLCWSILVAITTHHRPGWEELRHQKFTSPTSGGWKPKIRGRPGRVLGKVFFCAADCSLSLCPHTVGGARALSSIRTGPLSSPLEGPGTGQTGLVPTVTLSSHRPVRVCCVGVVLEIALGSVLHTPGQSEGSVTQTWPSAGCCRPWLLEITLVWTASLVPRSLTPLSPGELSAATRGACNFMPSPYGLHPLSWPPRSHTRPEKGIQVQRPLGLHTSRSPFPVLSGESQPRGEGPTWDPSKVVHTS